MPHLPVKRRLQQHSVTIHGCDIEEMSGACAQKGLNRWQIS